MKGNHFGLWSYLEHAFVSDGNNHTFMGWIANSITGLRGDKKEVGKKEGEKAVWC